MLELLTESIASYNLPLTVLLGLVILYWVISAIGVLDLEFDFDLDGDFSVEAGSALGALGGLLRFVNADRVPTMIVATVFVLFLWGIGMALSLIFNETGSYLTAGILFLPNFIVSLVCTKLVTLPLKGLFTKFRLEGEIQEPVVGRSGIVKSAQVDESYGQVEVITDSAPLLLNARVTAGSGLSLAKGTQVLIFDHDPERDLFLVREDDSNSHPTT